MTDEPVEDYFGFNDKETEAKKDPGLYVGAPLRPNELLAHEWMCRNSSRAEFQGAREVLFIDEDGEIKPEELTRWQRLMDYPAGRYPDETAIMAFIIYQRTKLEQAYWGELRDAAARDDADEAAAAQGRIDKQARKPAAVSAIDRRLGPVAPPARKNPFDAF